MASSSKTIFLALALTIALTITQAVLNEEASTKYNLVSSAISATLSTKPDQIDDTDDHHEADNKKDDEEEEDDDDGSSSGASLLTPSRRLSRFLAEKGDNGAAGRGAKKCEKVCNKGGGRQNQCCNNKCVDANTDNNNCGGCGKQCKYTESCCKGHCVDLSMDEMNCGTCPAGAVAAAT